jgi:hypothetical protein
VAETVGVFAQSLPNFAEFGRRSPISSNSAAYVKNILVFGFVRLRPLSDFAKRMELEMEPAPVLLTEGPCAGRIELLTAT